MKTARWACSLVLILALGREARSQVLVPVPVPVPVGGVVAYGGGGLGFSYLGRRLSVGGFISPFAPVLVGPGYPFAPFGVLSNRVVVGVIPPPGYVVGGARRRIVVDDDDDDLSGVDLDVVDASALEPRAARLKPPPAVVPPVPPPMPPPQKEKPKEPKPAPPPDVPRQPPPPQVQGPFPPKPGPPKQNPIEEANRLVDLGLASFREQFYGLAALRFRQAIEANPFSARPRFFLGQAYFALGKFRDAVAVIEAGMDRDPAWPQTAVLLQLDLYKGNAADFDEHMKRLEKAVTDAPKQADFLFLRGHQLWFSGRQLEAAGVFRRARALAPDPKYIDVFLRAAGPGPVAAN
jgi:hypothetical protein